MDLVFFKNKRVFITGHTGFKGSWLSKVLIGLGAHITGYALEPPDSHCLFNIYRIKGDIHSVIGDIRDRDTLLTAFKQARPEIVIHLAAQPIVLESYRNPAYTYETNVMGTVNILECVRQSDDIRSFLNVTTDKVYHNSEWEWGYRETDPLGGFDPYANSKSCSELVTQSYKNAFFYDRNIAISTARAGNVIGGGDFAANRIIPDCVRAAMSRKPITIRNPNSVRPYQHVLEPLFAYLLIVKRQYENNNCAGWYNVGPNDNDCVTTGELAEIFCEMWGEGQSWQIGEKSGPHEANFLRLDCSRIKMSLGWQPCWNIREAVSKTVEWTKHYALGDSVTELTENQIKEYMRKAGIIGV